MSLSYLDSRLKYGTDVVERLTYPLTPGSEELPESIKLYPPKQEVRVIVGELGHTIRMSAPSLNITIDGTTPQEVWEKFLKVVKTRDDSAWLTFDVGPTRTEEIQEGLDAPENEEWPEMSEDSEE
jgi:hypothetical protein